MPRALEVNPDGSLRKVETIAYLDGRAAAQAEAKAAAAQAAAISAAATDATSKANAARGEAVAQVATDILNPATPVGSSIDTALAGIESDTWVAGKAYAVGALVTTELGDRLRAVTAHTSSVRFTDDLPNWVAVEAPATEAILLQQARQSKGGSIGIGDRAAIAFRFDDWHIAFRDNIYPLLTARGVPAALATISELSAQSWAAGITSADMLAWNKRGIEVWSHGRDHLDPSPGGLTGVGGLVDQIVTSRKTIEAWGVKCQGWMLPGATPLGAAQPYGTGFNTLDSLYSYAGYLIRKTYPISEAYVGGVNRTIPTGLFHGADHITVSDGVTLIAAKASVDYAVQRKIGLVLMTHSGNLGKTGNMTLAEWTELLDYVVAYRTSGGCEILTPSGLMFADHSLYREELCGVAGVFDAAGTGWAVNPGHQIAPDGQGGYMLSIPSTSSALTSMAPRFTSLRSRGYDGETFVFEAEARSNGSLSSVSRVYIADYESTAKLMLSLTKSVAPGGWTKVRHAFTITPGTNVLQLSLGRNSGDGLDWRNIAVRKV